MTRDGKTRLLSATKDEVGNSVSAAYLNPPEELFGSKMEKESYLDVLTSEMMDSTGIPQSRS